MTLRHLCLVSILYLSFATMPRLVFAAETSAAPDELMSGYVKDGLHSEANVNFLGAVQAYSQAAFKNPEDRYAWMRLARAYRARDEFGKGIIEQFESQKRRRATEERLFRLRPAVTRQYWYCRKSLLYPEEFGRYLFKGDVDLLRPIEDNRIIHVDKTLKCKIGDEPAFFGQYRRFLEHYGYFDAQYKSDRYIRGVMRRQEERELSHEEAVRRKDKAWESIEEADYDDPGLWLDLGLASMKADADETEAACHVVLLSHPDKAEAQEARMVLSKFKALK